MARRKRYAKAVNDLRRKYTNELVRAVFVDHRHLWDFNPRIVTKVFETKDTIAIALWNDSPLPEGLRLTVKNGKFFRWADTESESDKLPAKLPARSIGLAIYNRTVQ